MSTEVHFTFIDYFFFGLVFIFSTAIGLYFAFRSKTFQTVDEYFFGGRKLGVLPVAFSIIATTISGSTTIGQSVEVYAYGLHNIVLVTSSVIFGFFYPFVIHPIFAELKILSSFTYLELRFDRSVKQIASLLFVITGLLLIPLTIYVPALAFQEVSGLNFYAICIISGFLCILYTTIGGYKAVVWSDSFQLVLITISTVVIFGVGLYSIGGVQNVWDALERGGRLKIFRTDLNLETRGSLWSYLLSFPFLTIYFMGLNQNTVQRYLSLSTLKQVKQTCYISVIIMCTIFILQLFIGAIIYANYEDCDPLRAGIVKKLDQIFPHFVQEKASLFPGFNGIFIAGVFSAGLSTTSTLLNTISGTIYVDFLSKRMQNVSQKNTTRIMKIIVIIVGAIGICLILVIERLGTIFAITMQCFTIVTVGNLGLFFNGMFFRNINKTGAKCGVIAATVVIGILIAGGLNKAPDPVLPLRTDGCDFTNITIPTDFMLKNSTKTNTNDHLPWIFRINFQFFCIIGLIINFFVGSIVSWFTGGNTTVDQRLFVKFLRKNNTDIPQETIINLLPQNKT